MTDKKLNMFQKAANDRKSSKDKDFFSIPRTAEERRQYICEQNAHIAEEIISTNPEFKDK